MAQAIRHVKANDSGMSHRLKYQLLYALGITILWWSGCTPEPNVATPNTPQAPTPEPATFEAIALSVPTVGQDGFLQKLPAETGIQFTNTLNTTVNEKDFDLLNGSGVALEDFDLDGLCDIYFASMSGKNKLYRNMGDWKFEDVTLAAGLPESIPYSSGAVFEDVDGDSYPDLLVSVFGTGVKMFQNQQNGRFTDVTQSHLQTKTGSTSLALADVDGDRDLDLYVVNYGIHTMHTKRDLRVRMVGGQAQVVGRYRDNYEIIDGKLIEYGEPDTLYLNDGAGRFEPVSWNRGAFTDEDGNILPGPYRDLGLSAMFRDINQDGLPDLYVCNDFQTPDRFWINQGRGRFQLIEREALNRSSYASMGIDFADVNRDGRDDFMVVDMLSREHKLRMTQQNEPIPPISITGEKTADRPQISRNTFFLNEGNGQYTELAHYAGLFASEWSWCPVFLDVDLDGYEDVLIINGHAQDNLDRDTLQQRSQFEDFSPEQLSVKFPSLQTPNLAFRNNGDVRFEEVGEQWGFHSDQVSNAIATADLDNDGDLDIVMNCLDAPAIIYENTSIKPRISVRLIGKSKNARSIGSRIVYREGSLEQSQEITSGGRYLSGDQARRTFAVFEPDGNGSLEIFWRSGSRTSIDKVKPNHLYVITEPEKVDIQEREPQETTRKQTWFQEVTKQITSPILPSNSDLHSPSMNLQGMRPQSLPKVIWADMDNDGDEDLVLSSQGTTSRWFENDGEGRFAVSHASEQTAEISHHSTLASFQHPNGEHGVLAMRKAMSPGIWEQLVHWRADGSVDFLSTEVPAQTAIISVGDYNGDSIPDIFLSNHSITGPFPQAPDSLLLTATDEGYRWDETNHSVLKKLRHVTDAEWIDWDMDGDLDLFVACEWGMLEYFLNEQGVLTRYTEELGLHASKGIWQAIGTGDFDENGRTDIIACNIGTNTPWSQWGNHSFRYYQLPVTNNIPALSIIGYNRNEQWWPVSTLNEAIPWFTQLGKNIQSHHAYAELSLDEILEDSPDPLSFFEVNTLETQLILNLPGRIEWQTLPAQAQWAPATGIATEDFNHDGHLDVFISQNWDGTNTQWAPLTHGRGLLMEGDGTGHFTPIKNEDSGIDLKGQQGSVSVADFNLDEKPDLLVYDSSKGIRLFQNQTPSQPKPIQEPQTPDTSEPLQEETADSDQEKD